LFPIKKSLYISLLLLGPGYLPWLDTVSKISRVFNSYKLQVLVYRRLYNWGSVQTREESELCMGQNLVCCPYTLPCPMNDLELKAPLIWVTDVVVMEVSSLYSSHAKRIPRFFE